MFRGFDEMRREIERAFEDVEKRIPKDLVREYTTPEGGKVREVGSMVYGYSMTVGPDGKPRIREFGNVKPSRVGFGGFSRPEISGETEPLVDVTQYYQEQGGFSTTAASGGFATPVRMVPDLAFLFLQIGPH
jgi:HSP20 family protein